MLKEVPTPLTSASQKVILVTGRSVSMTMLKLEMAETSGMLRVAPKLPVQLLLPDSRASQSPPAPGRHLGDQPEPFLPGQTWIYWSCSGGWERGYWRRCCCN